MTRQYVMRMCGIDFGHVAILCLLASVHFPSAASAAAPEFTAIAADGARGLGRIIDLSDKDGLSLDGDKAFHVKSGELIELRRVGAALPALPVGQQLLLGSGDRIGLEALSEVKLKGDKLQVVPAFGNGKLTLPLSSVALFWKAPAQGTVHPERVRIEMAAGIRKRDNVLLTNGDTLEGLIEGWDETDKDKGLKIQVDRQRISLPPSKLAAVAFSTEGQGATAPSKPFMRVVLASGSRLSLTEVTCDRDRLTGKTSFGTEVHLPVEEFVAITVHRERAVYLSDMKPTTTEETPFLSGATGGLRVDRSTEGDELTVGGNCYDKGLGTRSGMRITYALDAKYQRFETIVGLDDRSGREGRVRVRILVDGKERAIPALEKQLKWRPAGVDVTIDVKGAKELTLVVEAGSGGPVDDALDWCNARLVR